MPPSASEHGPRCADDGRGGEGGAENGDGAAPASLVHPAVQRAVAFIGANSLLAMMFGAIALAWLYPPLGTELVYPDITASWLAVVVIFFVSGVSLRTEEFTRALDRPRFNLFVQIYSFFVVSGLVYVISNLMVAGDLLPQSLADGIVICSCLPQAICTVIVLTNAAGGDEASSILNTAFSNLIGIVLSPVLILCYLGVKSSVEKTDVILKLGMKVALPLIAGQLVHHLLPGAKERCIDNHRLKQAQEYAMIFIIFTTFSKLFTNGLGTGIIDVLLMGACQSLIMIVLSLWCWLSLRLFFPRQPKLHASGLFICVSKTMPMGIPLINALYGGDEHLALYTLPLLMWYPLTIVMGVVIAPHVLEYVVRQERKLLHDDLSGAVSSESDYYEEMKDDANQQVEVV